jgi:pyrroloquinoline-quinone synthase
MVFEAELRRVAADGYHDKHAFHVLLNGGELSRPQIQAWALNRYCFQNAAPQKDAILISRSPNRDFRREWTLRLLDHDGFGQDGGGLERWLTLTTALGLDRDYVMSTNGALPKTLEIIDTYLDFVRTQPFVAAVATTLTELFAAQLHRDRFAAMLSAYDFIDREALTYFKKRLTHAPRDASYALEFVLANATTATQHDACLKAVDYKCRMLWALLDALHEAYVTGPVPESVFNPGTKPERRARLP